MQEFGRVQESIFKHISLYSECRLLYIWFGFCCLMRCNSWSSAYYVLVCLIVSVPACIFLSTTNASSFLHMNLERRWSHTTKMSCLVPNPYKCRRQQAIFGETAKVINHRCIHGKSLWKCWSTLIRFLRPFRYWATLFFITDITCFLLFVQILSLGRLMEVQICLIKTIRRSQNSIFSSVAVAWHAYV